MLKHLEPLIGKSVDTGLAQLPKGFQGKLALFVPLPNAGQKLLLRKGAGKLLDLLLVLGEGKVHS